MAEPRVAAVSRSGTSLDAALERFERFSAGLVRLEPASLEEVREEVERFAAELERHLDVRPPGRRRGPGGPSAEPSRTALLAREHERFRTSLEELRGIVDVVLRDDHGGHRQALGQYGRILAEALRLHRADERGPGRPRSDRATGQR